MTDPDEQEALSQAIAGDREAFGLLYERYVTRIFNYVYYRTGNPHDAEDLTARVFYRAMHHIRQYQDRAARLGVAVPHCSQPGGELAPRSRAAHRDPPG